LVDRVVVGDDPRDNIKQIDVDTTALVSHPIDLPRSSPGTAKLILDRPGRINVETIAPQRQLLVISESYHAGWRAYLDDCPIDVEAVNGDFMGCVVPAGNHCVRLEFAPRCLAAGKAISLAGLVLTGLLIGLALRRRRLETLAARSEATACNNILSLSSPAVRDKDRKILVCVPVFNDWECAAMLLERIDRVVEQQPRLRASVLLVDDGSTDATPDRMSCRLQAIDEVEILRLRRNVGHQRAIALGLTYINAQRPCDAVVVMDADGEDSPEDIPQMLDEFESHQGRRVVFAKRARRSEGIVFRFFYQCYKRVHRMLTGLTVEVGNFSIMPVAQLDRLVGVSELWNHYAASVFKARLPVAKVPIARGTRLCGQSKMNFASLVVHGLSAISVFGEQVTTRLLVGASIACGATLLAMAGVFGVCLGFGASVPSWVAYILGLLVLAAVGSLALALMVSVSILQARSHTTFLPLRDYEYYISDVRLVAGRRIAVPKQCIRLAA
jgi:polyisoprenyl-phosphate glycosyltransferase